MGRNHFVYSGIAEAEITGSSDVFRNTKLVGCWITPQDPIIKYYTQQIQEKLMKGETAGVENGGYNAEKAVQFMMGVYAATYLSHMVYSSTGGIDQKSGDVSAMIQNVRLPREVVTGNTGLCIELSILYASIMKGVGLHPVIFYIPGHAYPGVKTDKGFFAIEATRINGEGIGGRDNPENAFKRGMEELEEFFQRANAGDPRYTFVDIDEMEKQGVVSMELRDDEFLRRKVDEMAATFNIKVEAPAAPRGRGGDYAGAGDAGGGGGNPNPAPNPNPNPNPNNMKNYSGAIAFSYPGSWTRKNNPIPQLPFLVSVVGSPEDGSEIDVFNVQGAGNGAEAMEYIRQGAASVGINIQYQQAGSSNGYDMFKGVTNGNTWQAVFRKGGNGIVGLSLNGNIMQNQNLYNSIVSTIR
jgi:hypothetical protein